VAGVVGIVTTMPCHDMEVTAPVTSWVWVSCVGSLVVWRGIGRSDVGARAPEGSGETESCVRGQRGRASRVLGPRPGDCGWFALSFAIFIILIWVALFMVPNSSPRAFEGVKAPFQRFYFKGLFDLELFYFLRRVRASAPAGCSPRAFWRNGVIPSKAFTPKCCSQEYWGVGCVFFTRSAYPYRARRPPSPFPTRVDQVLSRLCNSVPHSSFRSEEGWVAPHYPRWASIDVSRELQAGKSKWMSESRSLGVG